MRTLALVTLALLGACHSAPTPLAHAPVRGATQPARVIAESPASAWQEIPADELLVMEFAGGGRTVIQLAPAFAPVHVANIRLFARAGTWSKAVIYRVQDNYVTQWGNNADVDSLPAGAVANPPAEYDRALDGLTIRDLAYADAYAPRVGHVDGWPVAYDPLARRAWLPHCYASVAVARALAPSTGSATELYTVIGTPPRHLDRNIASVGRVIDGMALLSSRPRGTTALGMYDRTRGETPIPIARIRLASDLPEADRPRYEMMRTDTPTFAAYLTGRANRDDTFFTVPAGGVDVCNAAVPVRAKR